MSKLPLISIAAPALGACGEVVAVTAPDEGQPSFHAVRGERGTAGPAAVARGVLHTYPVISTGRGLPQTLLSCLPL
jgi:hypothetical protein